MTDINAMRLPDEGQASAAVQAHDQPVNNIRLASPDASKITHVSLYSWRAEITRLFEFSVFPGQNQLIISGLPATLDTHSLRVQGRGSATIHDVTVSATPKPKPKPKSAVLTALYREREWLTNALSRRDKALLAAHGFLDTLNAQYFEFAQLGDAIEVYDAVAEKLSVRITDLRRRLGEVEKEIEEQEGTTEEEIKEGKTGFTVAMGVFAAAAGQVELLLIYSVDSANWDATYEIRVDMNEDDKPVTLLYKAAITQGTGENWENIPLTLETATPTFSLSIPTLQPWSLSFAPHKVTYKSNIAHRVQSPQVRYRRTRYDSESDEQSGRGWDDEDYMKHQEMTVMSKGNVSASFRVPGLITVPSGYGAVHNVTIAQLTLAAKMSWVSVPKADFGRVHLKAAIENASDYTLLSGNANVYVDGSFIAQSSVPAVSPKESFHIPLGLDPSIRITYHPRTKSVSQRRTGLLLGYRTLTTYAFSQRITIHNTKTVPLEQVQLKVTDQVPVTTDERIIVKVLNPPLVRPWDLDPGFASVREPVKVAEGIIAQWEGADDLEAGGDPSALGKDGKFYWLCAVPAMGKVDLNLEWEVVVPAGEGDVGGL